MKKLFWLLLLLPLCLSQPVRAGVDEAKAAYIRGNYEKALAEVKPLAAQGNPEAQWFLANLYLKGLGIPKDPKLAFTWFEKSALQGYDKAEHALGLMYSRGYGVKKDFPQAVYWYQKAADHGYAESQNNLGLKYEYGQGVPRNYEKAAEWFRKAAQQGHAKSQMNLGRMYQKGTGVPQDNVKAYMWYELAAMQGDKTATQLRIALANKMTPQQIDEAVGLAQDWEPTETQAKQ